MVDVARFFGPEGAWKEACDLYQQRHRGALPPEVLEHADREGEARIAYLLGYLFATILKKREMPISVSELEEIARRKITSDTWSFLDGFKRGDCENHAAPPKPNHD